MTTKQYKVHPVIKSEIDDAMSQHGLVSWTFIFPLTFVEPNLGTTVPAFRVIMMYDYPIGHWTSLCFGCN